MPSDEAWRKRRVDLPGRSLNKHLKSRGKRPVSPVNRLPEPDGRRDDAPIAIQAAHTTRKIASTSTTWAANAATKVSVRSTGTPSV